MTNVLSDKLNTAVQVGRVHFIFFDRVIVNDLLVMSNESDTLLSAHKLSTRFKLRDILADRLHFSYVNLSDGVFNLANESDSTTNLSRILAGISRGEEDSTAASPDIFSKNVKLNNFRFTLRNPYSNKKDTGSDYLIDFSDLSVSKIYVNIQDIYLQKDTLTANIKNISFYEKSGFNLKKLSGEATISPKKTQIENLILSDSYSDIVAKYYYMEYDSGADFSDYVNRVRMGISLNRSRLNFLTLGRFARSLIGNNLNVYLTGEVHGPVSNLRTDKLRISTESGLTNVDVKARFSGLPNTNETMAFVDIENSRSTIEDLKTILYSFNGNNHIKIMQQLSSFVDFSFQGRLAGLLNDFVANGTLNSNIGDVYMDVLLRGNPGEKGIDLIGNLKPNSFNVGALINNKSLGRLTMSTTMSALLKNEGEGGNRYMIDSLNVQNLDLLGYSYKNIEATGNYVNDTFDGEIIVKDPNLDLLFQGTVGLPKKGDSYFNFYSDIIYADLKALNIKKRDSISAVSLQATANFTKAMNGDLDGEMSMRNLFFTNEVDKFSIGDIDITSTRGENGFNAELISDFADMRYNGSDFITDFVKKLLNMSLHDNLNALFPEPWGEEDKQSKHYKFEVDFKDTRYIAMFMLPELYVANNSTLSVNISRNDEMSLILKSKRLGYKDMYADNLNLDVNGNSYSIKTIVLSDIISLNGIDLDSTALFFNINDNKINIKTEYSNRSQLTNLLDFTSSLEFIRIDPDESPIVDFTIDPSVIYLNGQDWHFDRSRIIKQDSTYVFYNVNLFSTDQSLEIDGIVSLNPQDTLSAKLKNIDISFANSLFRKSPELKGYFTGYANAINLYKEPQVLFDLDGKQVELFGKELGKLGIISEWDNPNSRFSLHMVNNNRGKEQLNIDGYYRPEGEYLSLNAKADSLDVGIFESFLSGIYYGSKGTLSGDILLSGPISALDLTSDNTRLNNLFLIIDYTKVPYILNGPVSLTNRGVTFNSVDLRDRAGNRGVITGDIEYRNFKDLRFNNTIIFNNLEAIDLRESDNPNFYGNAYVTGKMAISGSLSKILMDISLRSDRNSKIHIPISNNEISKTNILTFTPVIRDTIKYQEERQHSVTKKELRSPTELEIKLTMNATPDAAIVIEIDRSVGDVITGYGNGLIALDINPSKDIFNIRGDYNILRGSYKFVLQGIWERDFTIREGGNIRFNGDIMRTNLDLTAIYTTRASVNTLLAESQHEVASIRRNVDCIIDMSGALSNPHLNFEIDIPDIDLLTKARVDAALNTDDKIVTQIAALLVTGSFIPEMQSSIVNNSTSMLYSNATELLSSQINRVFSRLGIPLDLNFNYAQGQDGRDLFDAAISTQMFNNRVVINGAIGNSDYKASNVVVGNLDVELKIDDKGRFRAKAFTRSADSYSSYLDNLNNNSTQRTGVGAVYQEEFSTFRELFNRIFGKRDRQKGKEEKGKSDQATNSNDTAAIINDPKRDTSTEY